MNHLSTSRSGCRTLNLKHHFLFFNAVAGRNRGRLSIILYKHGGGLFEAQELERVERAYGNIFSVVGRTTGVKVLLLVAHERLSGHSLRVWDSAGESEWETDIVAREAWGSILLRDHH